MALIEKLVNSETGEIQTHVKQIRIVDTAEPWEMQEQLIPSGWERNRLISGDYWFLSYDMKKIGIERKEIDDFIGSLNERLTRQLESMLEHYDKSILLIEGSWKRLSPELQKIVTHSGMQTCTWTQVWNYLRSWQDKGLTIELTINKGHTVQRLNELYTYYQKPYHSGGNCKSTFNDDRILAFPSGCRGKTAIDAIEKFGSLENICKASKTDLQTVKNIGERKAELIYHHFHYIKGELPLTNAQMDFRKE